MTQDRWTAVDDYLADRYVPSDRPLEAALQRSDAAGLPPIHVAPNQGKFLMLLAKAIGARSVLEIGTLAGYSTIWLARGVGDGGRVVTLELERKHAEIASANLAEAGVQDIVEVIVGPAAAALKKLVEEDAGPFDLIFIDADKAGYPAYLDLSLRLSRPGTLIVGDNVVRDGAVIDDDETDPNVEGARRFNELFGSNPHVIATAIQTVGVKGYDGFAIGLVTD